MSRCADSRKEECPLAVSVYIPTPYRQFTGGAAEVSLEARTLGELLRDLAARYPGIGERVLAKSGDVVQHVNVYVNDVEFRSLQGLDTPLKEGDEVALIPAMAGGAGEAAVPEGAGPTPGPLLTEEQLERYSRQIRLDEIGPGGQARLLRSRVAVVGAGGLGSPAAIYLATAGVGTIGVIDADRVDLSNLHRQILHFDHDVGRPKTRSARRHLEDLNPDVTVVEHPVRLTSENALDILAQYDLVVNGSDNFPTRYLVNDACVLLGKPLVDASILQWEGQLSVFLPGQGCYRCLFPEPPAPGTVPSCAEGGIVGAVAGVMGALQALEALKILLGLDGVLADRTLVLDARTGRIRTLRRRRRPECPACGDQPTIRNLIDYEAFCGLAPAPAPRPGAPAGLDVPVTTAAGWFGQAGVTWVDVREPAEYEQGHVPGARLIPLDDLPGRMAEIPRDRPAVLVCRNGQRSALAAEVLRGFGYAQAYNLAGGMIAWENQGLPVAVGPEAPARVGP